MKSYLVAVSVALAACASPDPDGEPDNDRGAAEERALPNPAAQNRVAGLMSLPEVFGDHTCAVYAPSEIALFAQPDSSRSLGVIRVAQPWTMHENGGCEGLRVVVHVESTGSVTELPTLEYAYEMPGAVVVGRHDSWFKIRLAEGEAWIRRSVDSHFIPIEDLLASNLTYIARPDGAGLSSVPGSTDRPVGANLLSEGRSVRLLESRSMSGELWLKVVVQSHSPCESLEEPTALAEGWLPAHTVEGDPIVWFHSRGC